MKRINVDQGSKEWLKWRKTVITATDCPAIMGSSPYQTAYKCWQRKLGLIEEQASNAAMERGKHLEPIARDKFMLETGILISPAVVESEEYSFLGASLDGITEDNKIIVEIKCGGDKLHNMALNRIIPDYYLDQIQHQLLVTGAEKAYYYSFDGTSGIKIEVTRDSEFMERFLPKARSFWKGIAINEPPAMTEKDYKDMTDNLSWSQCAKEFHEVSSALVVLEEKKDYLRKRLIELCEDQSCKGSGVKVLKIFSKGRVDYDAIPEIKTVDIEKYRKASSSSWKILVDQSK